MAQEQQVYVTAHITVSKTTDSEGRSRCIRIQRFPSSEACDKSYRRMSAQKQLEHPNICRIYEVRKEDSKTVRTEMEWCGTPLDELRCSWTQEDCWYLLCSLSAALAFAQRQGLPHSGIHLGAIYFTEEGHYKVGKFGSIDWPNTLSSVSNPFFLCPTLRKAYSSLLLGDPIVHHTLNPYKSDVYSLALVLTHLLSPETPLNPASIQSVVSSLPLHESFQTLLLQMVETEEETRLDWVSLEQAIIALQGGQEEKAEEMKEEPQSRKRRVKIVKKPQTAELVPVVAEQRQCEGCGRAYVFNSSEPWRLDLIGSVNSEPAAKYCSRDCFSRTLNVRAPEPPAFYAEDEEDEEDLPEVMGILMKILKPPHTGRLSSLPVSILEEPYEHFYHCFRHKVFSRIEEILTPTVLEKCPECPAGDIITEVLQPLNVEITRNSLYPPLIFIKEQVVRRFCYFPISAVFKETLMQAECHLCSARLFPKNWFCFFHGNRLDLACSPCFLAATAQGMCPICHLTSVKFPSSAAMEFAIETIKGRILKRDEQWCRLCKVAATEWILPCGHSFCFSCLSLQPDLPDSLACLHCGIVLNKSELFELLEALGRS